MTVTIRRELREKLEKFSNLPSMPQIIARIQQISGDPKASVADLSNAILSDHQLTSRILRMANSTYYGEYSGKESTEYILSTRYYLALPLPFSPIHD